MQPARAEVVQNLIRPSSTATTGAFFGARMSLPSWRPWPRGSPKSFVYRYGPTTGKTIGLAVTAPPDCAETAAAPATRAAARIATTPRTVLRRFRMLRTASEAGRVPTGPAGSND